MMVMTWAALRSTRGAARPPARDATAHDGGGGIRLVGRTYAALRISSSLLRGRRGGGARMVGGAERLLSEVATYLLLHTRLMIERERSVVGGCSFAFVAQQQRLIVVVGRGPLKVVG